LARPALISDSPSFILSDGINLGFVSRLFGLPDVSNGLETHVPRTCAKVRITPPIRLSRGFDREDQRVLPTKPGMALITALTCSAVMSRVHSNWRRVFL
jgi:hypothetical protein